MDAGTQIRAWTAVGAMTPEAVFARFDERVLTSYDAAEVVALSRNFAAICDDDSHVSEPAFTKFVTSKIGLSPTLTKAVQILFESLCYLSQVPLQTVAPPPTYLTLSGLRRALMWILPSRERSVINATVGHRIRNPADHKRLIFQSLATLHPGFQVPFEVRAAQSLAVHNATIHPADQIYAFQEAGMNFDEDGDETYQDVLDILVSTPPYVPVPFAPPDRNAFRDLAKQLHKGAPSLYELVVPKHRLEALFSLLLATNFVDTVLDVDRDIESVARCIASSFRHISSSEHDTDGPVRYSLPPVNGVTWPMFHSALTSLLPHLLDPLFNLLGTVFFDGLCPFDANTGYCPTSEAEAVLTLPRMAQLETFLFNSVCLADIRRWQSYSTTSMPTTSRLIEAINNIPECAVLIVSGRTAAHDTCIFGAFVARPLVDGASIEGSGSYPEATAVLFQLSPTHDVYRGKIGFPAWSLVDEEIVFGQKHHGAALTLDSTLTTAQFTHKLTTNVEKAVYCATEHRGDFGMSITIDKIELWGEDPQ